MLSMLQHELLYRSVVKAVLLPSVRDSNLDRTGDSPADVHSCCQSLEAVLCAIRPLAAPAGWGSS
jgi:hypothetical protein